MPGMLEMVISADEKGRRVERITYCGCMSDTMRVFPLILVGLGSFVALAGGMAWMRGMPYAAR